MSSVGSKIHNLGEKCNSGVDLETHCQKIKAVYVNRAKYTKYTFHVNKYTWVTGRKKFIKTMISRRSEKQRKSRTYRAMKTKWSKTIIHFNNKA